MLNKNNERELAYVVKIDNILPIEGSDNCEDAHVLGWHVMVRKNTFTAGDLAIYFEIDSHLNTDKPCFSFLAQKKGNIKTQRYTFGGKGLFYSQGLLMSPKDFGWKETNAFDVDCGGNRKIILDENNDPIYEGDFLTKKLEVTYAVLEDNKRKSNGIDKYKKMSQRHPKLFSKPLFRWLMRGTWGKKLLFVFFGKKRDNKNSFPAWVVKTDEERCLLGNTQILTDAGYIQIQKIVNKKLNVKVASVNSDGVVEFNRILSYQKYNNNKEMITIGYSEKPGVEKKRKICCTPDHKFLTDRGYVEAKNLTENDTIYITVNTYGKESIPCLYGMLLGDSHISKDKRNCGVAKICHTNGEKQLDYLRYKHDIFNSDKKITKTYSGYNRSRSVYKTTIGSDAVIGREMFADFIINGKKTVTESVANKLTWESLAFWYMDDGCLSFCNKSTNPFIRINTQGFSFEENVLLKDTLENKFGILSTVETVRKNGKEMFMLRVRNKCVDSFLLGVAPYMCKCMSYKMLDKYRYLLETKTKIYKKHLEIAPIQVRSIEHGQTKNKYVSKRPGTVYDIEVENNHNFIADGVVVHNCQNIPVEYYANQVWYPTEKIDGSSTTFTVKGFGRKRQFVVCSRNVAFDKPDKKCYYDTNIYTEMAEKYDMETILAKMLDEAHKLNSNIDFLTIQAETYGEGVQKRDYNLKCHDMAIFNIIWGFKDGTTQRLNPFDGKEVADKWGLPYVPVFEPTKLPNDCDAVVAMAGKEKSKIDGGMREGLVFRSKDGTKSFKVVDPEFLLKYHG